ncbi:MAG: smalltalk protein [Prevotella sp.]|jgi:hypothetical protein|nr:smalltalk protein [Prevotella sp.]
MRNEYNSAATNIQYIAMNAACSPHTLSSLYDTNDQILSNETNTNTKLDFMKFLKDLKTWKTIIQFIITVLTAIISSFFVQSCVVG